jgi:large subunit ribosomal protein L17
MRHYKKGRKLGTDASHTKAIKKSLVANLFAYDRIKTTLERAKEIRGDVDRVITWAKRGDVHSRRLAIAKLGDKDLVAEIFSKVKQGMFEGRPGGYSRILRVGTRRGDSATIVIMELVQEPMAKKGDKAAGAGAGAGSGAAGSEKAAAKRPFGRKGAVGKAKDAEDAAADEAEDAADEAEDAADEAVAAEETAATEDATDEAAATEPVEETDADANEAADDPAAEAADEPAAAAPVEGTDAAEPAAAEPAEPAAEPAAAEPAEDAAPTPEDAPADEPSAPAPAEEARVDD